jgi:hypothetical protein
MGPLVHGSRMDRCPRGHFGDDGLNGGDALAVAVDIYWREIGRTDDDDDNDSSDLLVADIVDQLLPE